MDNLLLIKGDSQKIMANMPRVIDCVITDPPYNVSRPTNFQTMGSASRIVGKI